MREVRHRTQNEYFMCPGQLRLFCTELKIITIGKGFAGRDILKITLAEM
jgi:hypothetical protein